MSFSEIVIAQAWRAARGKCEKCGTALRWGSRGVKDSAWGWEAHHIHSVSSGGHDGLSNCKILCIKCHEETSTYGQ